jgi:hypothetical protein
MQIHGLEPATGETAFAFCVLRLRQATARSALMELIESLAPLIPDADTVIDDLLPEDLEQAIRIIAVPWQPPHDDVTAQRRIIENAGVEEAWFFQTGTTLPPVDEDGDDEDADLLWSDGPPPQVTRTRFPVDGTEDPDTADFGIAIKLAGEILPGEGTVLLAFHTMWLAPYGGRYRNAAVTIDRNHHAAQFWVDRFEPPCDAEELVGHLLWIVAKLDEVIPVVHARIVEATLAQKYGELMGETDDEPFVLGGNPLLAAYALGGERGVDDWIARQSAWSNEEVAQMLREVAVEIVTVPDHAVDIDDDDLDEDLVDDEEPRGRRATQMKAVTAADLDEVDQQLHHELRGSDEQLRAKGTQPYEATRTEEEAAPRHDHDRPDDSHDHNLPDDDSDRDDRGRAITSYAADILRERARLGRLDPRAVEPLRSLLSGSSRFEVRRRAAIDILGAARAPSAVASLIAIARATKPDTVAKSDLLTAAVTALGHIGDRAAAPVLVDIVTAEAPDYDVARTAAADALISCGVSKPVHLEPLLRAIRDRGNAESRPAMLFAAGRLAQLATGSASADVAKRMLADLYLAGEDPIVLLAREGALVMLGEVPSRQLAALLHECLTTIDYDHESTVRKLRVALQVAELVPTIVNAADLTWLTCFVEADIRARAHGLLARLGMPLPAAPVFDRYAVQSLGDDDVIEIVAEARVIGRAALVAEAARRSLVRAIPAIVDACHEVISRARHGEQNLLDPDARTLEAAVPFLRRHLDDQVVALFDRMLRHPSYHVKWELLQYPPLDERLMAGMFHVLGERWDWQEETARQWLANFRGTALYELERRRGHRAPAVEVRDDRDETNDDDQDMN